MKNICIPNPTLYYITYTDSNGNLTKRSIVPIAQSVDSITAYDYLNHGIRTFLKNNIKSITTITSPQKHSTPTNTHPA